MSIDPRGNMISCKKKKQNTHRVCTQTFTAERKIFIGHYLNDDRQQTFGNYLTSWQSYFAPLRAILKKNMEPLIYRSLTQRLLVTS